MQSIQNTAIESALCTLSLLYDQHAARRRPWPQGPGDILLLVAVVILGSLWTWRAHSSHHHVLVRPVNIHLHTEREEGW
jgi:hypothetical protein